MKLLHYPLTSFLLNSSVFLSALFSNNLILFFPYCDRPSFTPIQYNRQVTTICVLICTCLGIKLEWSHARSYKSPLTSRCVVGCILLRIQAVQVLGLTPTLVSVPGESVWNLWWTKWHCDWFFSRIFGVPLNLHCMISPNSSNKKGRYNRSIPDHKLTNKSCLFNHVIIFYV